MKIVLTTCPNEKSENLRDEILNSRLAGCILSIPMNESKFLWEGKIDCGNEVLLIFKTGEDSVDSLFRKIKEIHPYDVPFIAEIDISKVNKEYEKWLNEVTGD